MPATAVRSENPQSRRLVPSGSPQPPLTGGLEEGCLSFPELLTGSHIDDPKPAPKETESTGKASRTFHQESLGRGVTLTYEGGLWSIECATQGGLRGLWNRGLKVFSKKNTGSCRFQLGDNIDDSQMEVLSKLSKTVYKRGSIFESDLFRHLRKHHDLVDLNVKQGVNLCLGAITLANNATVNGEIENCVLACRKSNRKPPHGAEKRIVFSLKSKASTLCLDVPGDKRSTVEFRDCSLDRNTVVKGNLSRVIFISGEYHFDGTECDMSHSSLMAFAKQYGQKSVKSLRFRTQDFEPHEIKSQKVHAATQSEIDAYRDRQEEAFLRTNSWRRTKKTISDLVETKVVDDGIDRQGNNTFWWSDEGAQYSGYCFRSKKERVEHPAGWTCMPTTTKRRQEMAETQEQEARSFRSHQAFLAALAEKKMKEKSI